MDGYPSDVAQLFQGTSSAGIFDNMKTVLDGLDGTAGLIKTTRTALDNTLKTYLNRIQSQQLRLDVRRQELQQMYAAADEAMSRLNSMSSQIANLGR